MNRVRLLKPDGRELLLYAVGELPDGIAAPQPPGNAPANASHLRWHPLRREWVVYAGHRQHRTFLPPPNWNPLAVTTDPEQPTELPAGPWEVAVFENRFAALSARSPQPGHEIVDTRPAHGRCEVIVFAQDPGASLSTLSAERIALIIEVWAERTRELGARKDVDYVLPFENRGVEVGVTLHHPHGQIYAYPFVPPIPARHVEAEREFLATTGTTLMASLTASELDDGRRLVYRGRDTVSYVPVCARHPYEQWIVPRRRVAWLDELDGGERLDLARGLLDAVTRLDRLFAAPMPYVLVVFQAPTDGGRHAAAHAHIQIYPAFRMPGRLKYLAGSELGAGTFTADAIPEVAAEELRSAGRVAAAAAVAS